MIHKLGNVEDVKTIPNLCLGAKNAISKFTKILTEMYGSDRDVDHDMGGYVLYAEKGTSINELKNAFNYEENTFEYVQEFEDDVVAAIYVISTEFAVVLVMHLDNAPDIIRNAIAKTTYKIRINEILSRQVCVEAQSLDDALDKVREEYDAGNIILSADDFISVDFKEEC